MFKTYFILILLTLLVKFNTITNKAVNYTQDKHLYIVKTMWVFDTITDNSSIQYFLYSDHIDSLGKILTGKYSSINNLRHKLVSDFKMRPLIDYYAKCEESLKYKDKKTLLKNDSLFLKKKIFLEEPIAYQIEIGVCEVKKFRYCKIPYNSISDSVLVIIDDFVMMKPNLPNW